MIEMMEQMVEALAESDKFAPGIAKLFKKLYDSLLDEGFTAEQALEIVKGMNFTGSGS